MKIVVNQRHGKPILLANTQLKKINLQDESLFQVKLSYRKDKNLRVSVAPPNTTLNENAELSVELSLPYYINL